MSAVEAPAASRSQERPASQTSGLHLSSFYDLALRTMQRRLTRTLLTALGIVIGVAVILSVDITNATTLASIRNLFDETSGRASLIVEPAARDTDALDVDIRRTVLRVPGVTQAAPLLVVQTSLVGDEEPLDIGFGGEMRGGVAVMGVDPLIDPEVRVYELTAGRLLTADDEGRHVALVGESLAEEEERTVGDDLVVVGVDGESTFEIVGIVAAEGIGRTNEGQVLIAPLTTVQEVFHRRGQLSQIDVVVEQEIADSSERLERLKDALEGRLSRTIDVRYPAARGKLISQMLQTYQQGLNFFGAIAIFVGGFLIYNAFSMTVLERTHEIGMLRSIGATRWQITLLILTEGILLAIVGALFGLVVGALLARGLIQAMADVLAVRLETYTIPTTSLVKSVVIGIVVTLLSSLVPAVQGSRISPLAALRVRAQTDRPSAVGRWLWVAGLGLIVGGFTVAEMVVLPPAQMTQVGTAAIFAILLGAALLIPAVVVTAEPRLRPLIVRRYGPEGRIGSGNVQRSRLRTALTVAALMVGATMVIGLGEMSHSFRQDILAWVDTAIGGDLYVRSISPMRPELGRRIAGTIPGIEAITSSTSLETRLVEPDDDGDPDTIVVSAIEPATYLQVGSFKFADEQVDPAVRVAELSDGDAVFVATTLADRYDLERGDVIRIETNRGRRAFRVAAVVVDFSAQGNAITLTRDDVHRYFGKRRVTTITIDVQPGVSVQAVKDAIEERYGDREHVTVETSVDFRERVEGLMNQSFALLNALVGIAVFVSALGVINTLLMNILERTRELGMLRSLGMTRRQVAKMVLAESAAMGLIGGALGVIFGLLLSHVLVRGVNTIAGYRLRYLFTATPVALSLIIALGVSQLGALYPAYRATRVNIVEAIKHE